MRSFEQLAQSLRHQTRNKARKQSPRSLYKACCRKLLSFSSLLSSLSRRCAMLPAKTGRNAAARRLRKGLFSIHSHTHRTETMITLAYSFNVPRPVCYDKECPSKFTTLELEACNEDAPDPTPPRLSSPINLRPPPMPAFEHFNHHHHPYAKMMKEFINHNYEEDDWDRSHSSIESQALR